MSAPPSVVYVNGVPCGQVAALPGARHVFTYDPACPRERFVSLTMPVRLESYVWHELHPPFAALLPQDALLAALSAPLARAGGGGALELLARQRLTPGRVQLRGAGAAPVPETETADSAATALATAMQVADSRPAVHAQLGRAMGADLPLAAFAGEDGLCTVRDARWVYRCQPVDPPHAVLAAWCCQRIAARAGFEVPAMTLSADLRTLRLARDDGAEAARLGREDFCALTGLAPGARYAGSAEQVVTVAALLTSPPRRLAVRRELFRRFAFATLVRAGEAHLGAFALCYPGAEDTRLAPLAGLATSLSGTAAELPALPLGGVRSHDPGPGAWRRFARHCALDSGAARAVMRWLVAALEAEAPQLAQELATRGAPPGVYEALSERWQAGAAALGV